MLILFVFGERIIINKKKCSYKKKGGRIIHLIEFHFIQIKIKFLDELIPQKKFYLFQVSIHLFTHSINVYFKTETILCANIIQNIILRFSDFDVYSLA